MARLSARHCKRPYRSPAHILSTTYGSARKPVSTYSIVFAVIHFKSGLHITLRSNIVCHVMKFSDTSVLL